MPQPVAVTIGNFDGVHLGHQALLRACRDEVGPGGCVVVVAFDPHPQAVLAEREVPARLTTFDQRAGLLREAGADEVRKLEPDARLLALSPQAFAGQVLDEFKPVSIVEGEGFRFGRDRAGDLDLLAEVAGARGCRVRVISPVEVDLVDQTIVPVSSTRVRWLLGNGRVADASRLLGRPYSLEGPVVRCDRRGRTIGFPTANIDAATMLPGDGVYAALATLPDGKTRSAAVNVGTRPTVDGSRRCVEAHVLDVSGGAKGGWKLPPLGAEGGSGDWKTLPGLPEYGWDLRIDLLDWARDEIRFGSVEALVEQMHRDCARVREMVLTDGTAIRGGGFQPPGHATVPTCNQ
jgi:riboflavin kinase / FMN adenylyltransferase